MVAPQSAAPIALREGNSSFRVVEGGASSRLHYSPLTSRFSLSRDCGPRPAALRSCQGRRAPHLPTVAAPPTSIPGSPLPTSARVCEGTGSGSMGLSRGGSPPAPGAWCPCPWTNSGAFQLPVLPRVRAPDSLTHSPLPPWAPVPRPGTCMPLSFFAP